jgi:hypothetical protein
MAEKPKHDELFRSNMEIPNLREEFLDKHLPQYVKEIIDIKSIKLEKVCL